MTKPQKPRQYMKRQSVRDVYKLVNDRITYVGQRVIYSYNNKYYVIKGDGKAYQVQTFTIYKHPTLYVLIKPKGEILE
jgi:hypothetical protein